MKIKPGDPVIIFGGHDRVHFCQIPEGIYEAANLRCEAASRSKGVIQTRDGSFDLKRCIGKRYGQKLLWDEKRDYWIVVLKPTCELVTKTIQHHTQILYRADISLILLLLDLYPGKRVVECGTGSGSLSYSLATTVAPTGHVYTFEFHNRRRLLAEELFRKSQISDVITVIDGDAYAQDAFLVDPGGNTPKVTLGSIDAIFFDIPSPWKAIKNAEVVLKNMGKLVNFSPCIEQVQLTSQSLQEHQFADIRTFEIILKPWGINLHCDSGEDGAFSTYQLPQPSHTGYLTVATRINN